jgi:hypothetical protein
VSAQIDNVFPNTGELSIVASIISEAMEGKARQPIPVPKGQAIRTRLYVRVVEQFPEGWMTTGLLSRESESRDQFLSRFTCLLFFFHGSERIKD